MAPELRALSAVVIDIPAFVLALALAVLLALAPPPSGAAAQPVSRDIFALGLVGGQLVWAEAVTPTADDYWTTTATRVRRGDPAQTVGVLPPIQDGGVGAITLAGTTTGALGVARVTVTAGYKDIEGNPVQQAAVARQGGGLQPIDLCDPGRIIEGVRTVQRWAPMDADDNLVAHCVSDLSGIAIDDGTTGTEVDRVMAPYATAPRIAGSFIAYITRSSRYAETGDLVVFDRATRRERYRIPEAQMLHVADFDLASDGTVVLALNATSILVPPLEAWTASVADPALRRLPIPPSRFLQLRVAGDRIAYSRWDAPTHAEQVGVLDAGAAAPRLLATGPVLGGTLAFDGERVAYGYATCGATELVATPVAQGAARPSTHAAPRCPLRLVGRAPHVTATGRVVLRLDCGVLAASCFADVTATVPGSRLRPLRAGAAINTDGSAYAMRLTAAARARLRERGVLTLRLRLAFEDEIGGTRVLTIHLHRPRR
jgi:hypothetical protein